MADNYMYHGAMVPALDNMMKMIINNVLNSPENDKNDTDTDNMDTDTGLNIKYKDVDFTYGSNIWKNTFYNFIRAINNDDILCHIIKVPDVPGDHDFSNNYYDLLVILIDFTMRNNKCNNLFRKICSSDNLNTVFHSIDYEPDHDVRTVYQKYFRCRFVENLFIMLSNDRHDDMVYLSNNTYGDFDLWCNTVDDMYTKTNDVFDMLIPFDIPTESKEKILSCILETIPQNTYNTYNYKKITSPKIVFILYLSLKFKFKNAQKLLSIFKNYLISSDISFQKFFEYISNYQTFEYKYPNVYYHRLTENNCDLCFNIIRNDMFYSCNCLICNFIKQKASIEVMEMTFEEEENRPYYEHNYFMKYNGLCDFCSNIINKKKKKDHIYFNNFRINTNTWYYVFSRLLGPEITDKYTYDSLNLFEHKLISFFYDDIQFKDKLLITNIINNIDAFCLVLVKLYFHTTEYKMHEFRQNYFLYMDRFVDLSNIRKQFDSSLEEQYNEILLDLRCESDNDFIEVHYHVSRTSDDEQPLSVNRKNALKYLYPRLVWMFKNHIKTTIMGTNVPFTHYLFNITYPYKNPTINNLPYYNFILNEHKNDDDIQKTFNDIIKRLFSKLGLDQEEKNTILSLAKKHMENNDFNPIEKHFKITQ